MRKKFSREAQIVGAAALACFVLLELVEYWPAMAHTFLAPHRQMLRLLFFALVVLAMWLLQRHRNAQTI